MTRNANVYPKFLDKYVAIYQMLSTVVNEGSLLTGKWATSDSGWVKIFYVAVSIK